jgi:hypothetical protein
VFGDLSLDESLDVVYGEGVGGYEVDPFWHIYLLEQYIFRFFTVGGLNMRRF